MKKLCLFVVALLFVVTSFSQQKKYVNLKNGTEIKGKVYESEEEDKVRIYSSGNLWVFDKDEIESISASKSNKTNQPIEPSTTKFNLHTEIGVLIGNSDNSQSAPLIFQTSVNYKVSPQLKVGVGTGVEFIKETYLPVFANFEYKFRKTGFSPFVFLQGGYDFSIDDSRTFSQNDIPYYMYSSSWYWPSGDKLDSKGGCFVNSGLGITKMVSSDFGWSFSFGYRFTRLNYNGENDYSIDLDHNRLSLKLGIIFN